MRSVPICSRAGSRSAPRSNIKHLAASPVGATVRTTAKVIAVERRVIRFEVASFDGERKIGEGRHARGLVNVESFNKRFGATM